MSDAIAQSKNEERRLVEFLTIIGLMNGFKKQKINQNIAHFLIKEKGKIGHGNRKGFKKLLYAKPCKDKSDAHKKEYQIKQLQRNQKIEWFLS